jgi:hypothetical protein
MNGVTYTLCYSVIDPRRLTCITPSPKWLNAKSALNKHDWNCTLYAQLPCSCALLATGLRLIYQPLHSPASGSCVYTFHTFFRRIFGTSWVVHGQELKRRRWHGHDTHPAIHKIEKRRLAVAAAIIFG